MATDRLYLEHILDAIERVQKSVAIGREVFEADDDAIAATLRRLHTLSESTQRLSPELRARHPDVPWDRIRQFRNRIVHGYMDISLEVIWSVVNENLPPLQQMAKKELSD